MFTENKVILIKEDGEKRINNPQRLPEGLKVEIYGSGNKVKIGDKCKFSNSKIIIMANKANVVINEQCTLENMIIDINSGQGQNLEIGRETTFFGGKIVLRDKDYIKIGNGCLFAAGLSMWATDAHTLIDKETNQVINQTPDKLEIGNHCWIGADVHILKRGSLAQNTVVGMCSVVTKPFKEPNIVIGGYPAKVLRKGIDWSRDTIPNWKKRNTSLEV